MTADGRAKRKESSGKGGKRKSAPVYVRKKTTDRDQKEGGKEALEKKKTEDEKLLL